MGKRGKPAAKAVTERDLQIMARIGEGGLASFDQIKRLYWANAQDRTAHDRLTQLVKAGFLSCHRLDPKHGGHTVYTLTNKGANNFEKARAQRLMIGLPAANEIKQQLLAQAGRIAIERQLATQGQGDRLVEWRSERELRSEAAKARNRRRPFGNVADIADASMSVESADGTTTQTAIEIDGQYYGKMLTKKINSLAKSGQPVVWVTSGAGRGARIQSEVQQAGATNISVLVV
jgi:DNA-binding PadR family transcriptional regulator